MKPEQLKTLENFCRLGLWTLGMLEYLELGRAPVITPDLRKQACDFLSSSLGEIKKWILISLSSHNTQQPLESCYPQESYEKVLGYHRHVQLPWPTSSLREFRRSGITITTPAVFSTHAPAAYGRSLVWKIDELLALWNRSQASAVISRECFHMIMNACREAFMTDLHSQPEAARANLAMARKDIILNTDELCEVLTLLPETAKAELAMARKDVIINSDELYIDELCKVLTLLPEAARAELAMAKQDIIESEDVLEKVLYLLPKGQARADLAMARKEVINDENWLLRVLKLLPEGQARVDLAIAKQDIIKSAGVLETVLQLLPEGQARVEFVILKKGLLADEYSLGWVLDILSGSEKISFLRQYSLSDGGSNTAVNACYDAFLTLCLLPEGQARADLAMTRKEVINDGNWLLRVLKLLPEGQARVDLAMAKQDIISTPYILGNMLKLLPEGQARADLAMARKEVIHYENWLLHVLKLLPEGQSRADLAIAKQDIIESEGVLETVLQLLPEGQARITLMKEKVGLIPNQEKLSRVLALLPEFSDDAKKQIELRWQLARWEEKSAEMTADALNDPRVLQAIKLGRINPNPPLFDAIQNKDWPRFQRFLSHPSCDPLARDERARTLKDVIVEVFAGELQGEGKVWLQAVDTGVSERRRAHSDACITAHFASLPSAFSPVAFTRPKTQDSGVDESKGVDATVPAGLDSADWCLYVNFLNGLITDQRLSLYKEHFETLLGNTSFHRSAVFKSVLQAVQTLRENLDGFFQRATTSKVPWEEEGLFSQFSRCPEGVCSALTNLSGLLSSGNARVSHYVRNCVVDSLSRFASISGVSSGMEVHMPLALTAHVLGLEVPHVNDPYALPYHLDVVASAAAYAAYLFDMKALMTRLLPKSLLELEKRLDDEMSLLEQEDMDLLLQLVKDLESLYFPASAGTMSKEQLSDLEEERKAEVLALITGLTEENAKQLFERMTNGETVTTEEARFKIDAGKLQTLVDQVTQNMRKKLTRDSILISEKDEARCHQEIWEILTSGDPDSLSEKHQALWARVLTAPDGLGMIRRVVEGHQTEWERISSKCLVWKPEGCEKTLFRAFTSNPLLAEWFLGYSIKVEARSSIAFEERPLSSPFRNKLNALSEQERQIELEYLLSEPGAVLFWVNHFLSSDEWQALGALILKTVQEKDGRVLVADSVLALCREICKKTYENQTETNTHRTLASTFLESRLQNQKELELWDCYWNTACYIQEFKVDWRVFENSSALDSLSDPRCMQAFWYATRGNLESLEAAEISLDIKNSIRERVTIYLKQYATPEPAAGSACAIHSIVAVTSGAASASAPCAP